MNAASAKDPRFWNRIASKYARQPIADEEAYRKTLDRVRHYLGPRDRVL